jgi:hypothetical protein
VNTVATPNACGVVRLRLGLVKGPASDLEQPRYIVLRELGLASAAHA